MFTKEDTSEARETWKYDEEEECSFVSVGRAQLRANPISFRVTSAGSSMKRQYFPTTAGTKEMLWPRKLQLAVAGLQLQPVADLAKPDTRERVSERIRAPARVTKTLFLSSRKHNITVRVLFPFFFNARHSIFFVLSPSIFNSQKIAMYHKRYRAINTR